MRNKGQLQRRVLGVFTLAMINVCAIESLKNLPIMAKVGLQAVFFYVLAGVIFFIPCALVSAELATGWPSTGGVYEWVKQAFGKRWGFVAIWLQWIENVIWYPTILSFTAATIAYLFYPALAQNKFYMLFVILFVFWASTIINFFGMKASGAISSIGVMIGTIIPGALIIVLGIVWVFVGGPNVQVHFSFSSMIPDMSNLSNLVFLVGVLLALGGMEMSAVHAREVKNPQKDYPKAIFLSTFIILILSILGSLAVAVVVPQEKISLVAGVMQAFSEFFKVFHMQWATPILAVLIALGAIAMISTWIVGPSKGLLESARDGDIPPVFERMNKAHMPVVIMMAQGVLFTILSLVFLFMPTVSSSYWILTALTAQLYLLMYMLMFLAGIRLRYSQPKVERAYRIPFKNIGMWIVSSVGFLGSLFAVAIGFIPPSNLDTGNIVFYESFLGMGVFIMVIFPLLIYAYSQLRYKHD
jgi:glutamate:GABA antiporter